MSVSALGRRCPLLLWLEYPGTENPHSPVFAPCQSVSAERTGQRLPVFILDQPGTDRQAWTLVNSGDDGRQLPGDLEPAFEVPVDVGPNLQKVLCLSVANNSNVAYISLVDSKKSESRSATAGERNDPTSTGLCQRSGS